MRWCAWRLFVIIRSLYQGTDEEKLKLSLFQNLMKKRKR